MPAYIVARIDIRDRTRYAEYMKHTPRVIARYGGRFIVRGGETATLEGPPETLRLVIIEFPSVEQARAFYESPEYTLVKTLREGAGEGCFTLVEGCDQAAWPAVVAASQALSPPVAR